LPPCGQLKQKTLCIEKAEPGGVCLNWGCIPSKALLANAELVEKMRAAADQKFWGLKIGGEVSLDWDRIITRSREVSGKLNKGVEFLMRKNKVTVIRGYGTIVNPTKIAVKGSGDGASMDVDTKNIIIATGSEAKSLPGYSFDEDYVLSNIGALDLNHIPKSMLIVGSGAVGVEFASIYNSLGAKVTIIEVLPSLVPLEDEEISKELRRVFTRKGIDVYTKAKLESAKTKDGGVEVTFRTDKDEVKVVNVEKLLMATGRGPNTAKIGLENVGIATDRGFIKVNEYLETGVRGIYAIGDVTPSPLLAHVAMQEGIIAVERIADHHPVPINYKQVPGCTYCEPQIASVGLTEAKAREAGYKVKVGKFPFMAIAKAKIEEATDGFVKVVADENLREILGVHMIGHTVTEIIPEAVTAMALESTVDDVVNMIHAHPTLAEGVHEAMEAVFGAAIHI